MNNPAKHQNEEAKWAAMEFFCPNSTSKIKPCGDPVSGGDGKVYFTHRRMNFIGFSDGLFGRKAVYECPVCQHRREVGV